MTLNVARHRRSCSLAFGSLFLLFGVFLPVEQAEAQLRVIPQLGLYSPVGDLGEVRGGSGSTVLDLGRQSSTYALGVAAEVGGRDAGLGFRVGMMYATSSTLPVVGPQCPACEARANLLVGGAALVLRPIPPLAVVQPYLLLGGGVARYDFEDRELREEGFSGVLRNQTRPQLQLGIGTAVDVAGFRPRLELSAHFARFEPGDDASAGTDAEPERQANLFLTLGFPLGR